MKATDVIAAKRLLAGRAEDQIRGFNTAYGVDLFNQARADTNRIPGKERELATDCVYTRYVLREATAYWVSPDMTNVAIAAGETMPNESLVPGDLPSPAGFLVYDKPIGKLPIVDSEELISLQGVAWANFKDVLLMSFLASIDTGPSLMPSGFVAIAWNGDNGSHYFGNSLPRERRALRIFKATWTLMQQTLTVSSPVQIDRAERRRCQRVQIPSDLLVVQLRRQTSSAEGRAPGEVDWSHRWLVSGHWRNQYLPSRGVHRQQWIPAYVKGPADKPLIVKDRVTAWVR